MFLIQNIIKRNTLLGVSFLFINGLCFGKSHFQMTENCLKSQTYIYELKVNDALKLLDDEQKKTPNNLAIYWLKEHLFFITHFVNENEVLFKAEEHKWSQYLYNVENSKFEDPWKRFIMSDMYLHRAILKTVFNDHLSAGNDIKKANKLLNENEKKYPSFLPDNKNLGIIYIAASSLPKNYQWIANVLGFEGSMDKGVNLIETYLKSPLKDNEHQWMKTETAFMYAMVQHHLLKKTDDAWKTINEYTKNYKGFPLLIYMRTIVANYAGKNDESIAVLSSKPSNLSLQLPFYYLDYLLGLAKLKRLDSDADVYFKIFTTKYKGKNYIKSAYRYLAWYNIVFDKGSIANTYYLICLKSGQLQQEEDKQAEKEAKESIRWPSEILKPRLLFDGKYYKESLNLLEKIDLLTYKEVKFKLEILYRMARIYQETKMEDKAIVNFKKTIDLGKNETYYYAAYSSLQMGLIYEQQNKKTLALQYFNSAKNDFKNNEEYKNSIEQKAKAGIKRLKK